MNIVELSKQFTILPETMQAVARVEEMTGKMMDFQIVNDMISHAKLKAARFFMEYHIVYLKNEKLPHINHLIIHECYHIYRFWSVSQHNRKTLATTSKDNEAMKSNWKKELGARADRIPPQYFDMWQNGLLTIFYNAVTDTRIELSIYKDYPGVREEQLRSLKNLEQEVRMGMSQEIMKLTPRSLFLHAGAMNYVFLKLLEPIIGRQWRKSFKGHAEIISLGNRLVRCVPNEDMGLSQDIEILNKWADILGFAIHWNDFEKVPSTYALEY